MDIAQVLIALGGGAGITGLLMKLWQIVQERRQGELQREDTAIHRWQELRDEKAREAEKAWRIVQWYRANYPRLWAAYMRLPPEEKEAFPPTPPPEVDN